MAKPQISIILTSYNHGKYLRESIQSVLDQTYRDFELIILDDASTDNSWEIIGSYSDPRIRSFRNEVNRKGIRLADVINKYSSGDYIAVHHSDDVWEPQKLEKQVLFLDANPHIGAVFSLVTIIDEEGRSFSDESHKYFKVFKQPNRTRHEWLNHFFFHGNALCHPSVLIRKKCYEDCGYFRRGLAQLPDLDFWIRLCLKYDIYILQEKLVRFRVRADEKNVSGNRPTTRVRDHFEKLHILDNYQTIPTVDDLLMIFPDAKKYINPINPDINFALGRFAVDSGPSKVHKLFGLNLLFEAMNDPERAKKILEFNHFDIKDFYKLSGEHDVFSTEDSYVAKQDLINSKTWKMLEDTRQLRNRLAPSGIRHSSFFRQAKNTSFEILFSIKQFRKNRKIIDCINASRQFDKEYYLQSNPDLAGLNIDPLIHYCKSGWKEGRNPSQYFDTNNYIARHPEVISQDICPLYHWIQQGKNTDELTNTITDPLGGNES